MTNPTNDLEALAAKLELIKGPQAWLERWASHVGNCVGGSYCSCGLTMARMEIDAAVSALTALRAQDAVPVASWWVYEQDGEHMGIYPHRQPLAPAEIETGWTETPLYTHPSPNPAPQAADGEPSSEAMALARMVHSLTASDGLVMAGKAIDDWIAKREKEG